MSNNPFGDLDDEFAGAQAKAPAAVKLLPGGTYGFAIVPFDAKGDGVMVEYDTFKAGETTGIRMMLEALMFDGVLNKDEEGKDIPVLGEQVEKVFWVTANNIPYLKNDLGAILQREIPAGEKLSKTMSETWAGRTFQAALINEKDKKGVMRNSISFITQWAPEQAESKKETKKETAPAGGGKKQTKF